MSEITKKVEKELSIADLEKEFEKIDLSVNNSNNSGNVYNWNNFAIFAKVFKLDENSTTKSVRKYVREKLIAIRIISNWQNNEKAAALAVLHQILETKFMTINKLCGEGRNNIEKKLLSEIAEAYKKIKK